MRTTRKQLAYWGLTGVFAALMLFSAALYLTGALAIQQTMAHLGYPTYLLTILGAFKLIGAVALLQNRVPTLREWAYAGFTINLIGATASHAFSGDPIGVSAVPAMFLVLLAVSYWLKPVRDVRMIHSIDHKTAVAA